MAIEGPSIFHPGPGARGSNKRDVMHLLAVEGKFYLPPPRNVNASFLQDFLAGRKALLVRAQVQFLSNVPGFKELSVQSLVADFSDVAFVKRYLPNDLPWVKVDRAYAQNVTSSGDEYAAAGVRGRANKASD